MFAAEPPRTQWDLHFQLLGVPVRIHPLFWLAALLLGGNLAKGAGDRAGIVVLMWIAIMFFSILVHEFGHALAMRYFGFAPHVILYVFGGLAVRERNPYESSLQRAREGPAESILISAAGPAAGFVVAALVIASVYATGGSVVFSNPVSWEVRGIIDQNVFDAIRYLLFVNIYWGLINLLPVIPLDGGQIAREFLVAQDPWNGLRRALWVSVIAGAATALVGAMYFGDIFLLLLFGSLAVSSYLTLQQMSGGGGGYGGRPW